MNETRPNPYVGPRAFEAHEMLYGRDRELRMLSAQLISERIVLLHSPSGAGKTSLIRAGLVPLLESEKFHVLPVVRVNLEPDAEVVLTPGFNRYAYSVIASLEEELQPEQRRPLGELAGLTLDEYLKLHPRPEDAPRSDLLFFDQFEEILTTAPTDREGKQAFFTQLGVALRNTGRWALFAIREDYLGALAPYVRPIPNRFEVTFRLDLLGAEAALQAIQSPARGAGVEFRNEAARKLVDDLRSIQVQTVDGKLETILGQYVEPVQLQVVCYNLWEGHASDCESIDLDDVSSVGNVDQSLASYYADTVKRAVVAVRTLSGPSDGLDAFGIERLIRDWFEHQLITPEGFRGQVLMGFELSNGLDNRAIQLLENAHIVRGEKRAGATWFELSHDRLIGPIRASNTEWFEANLSLFQKQAVVWSSQHRAESLLFQGKELNKAEREARSRQLTENEQEFLKASRAKSAQWLRRRLVGLGFVIIIVFSMLGALFSFNRESQIQRQNAATQAALAGEAQQNFFIAATAQSEAQQNYLIASTAQVVAEENARRADEQAKNALAGSLAAQASSIKNNQPDLALFLALEAYQNKNDLLTRTTLFELLAFTPYTRLFGHHRQISTLAVSPDGKLLASAGCFEFAINQCKQGEIYLWDVATRQKVGELSGTFGLPNALAFRPSAEGGSMFLAAGGCVGVDDLHQGCADSKGQITLWDVSDPGAPVLLQNNEMGHTAQVRSLAFSPDGVLLASGGNDRQIVVWNISPMGEIQKSGEPLSEHTSFVNSLVFSPDGSYLLSASEDANIRVWDMNARGSSSVLAPAQHTTAINSLAFSADGRVLASSDNDGRIMLWQWIPPNLNFSRELAGHTGYVNHLAFSPDGKWLASAGQDETITLWDASSGEQFGPSLIVHTDSVNAVVFGSRNDLLISASDDRTIVFWDLKTRRAVIQPERNNPGEISAAQFVSSDDGRLSALADGQNVVLTDKNGQTVILSEHNGPITGLSFSPISPGEGVYLASASADQTVVVWDVTDPAAVYVYLRLADFSQPLAALKFTDSLQLLVLDNKNQLTRFDLNPGDWQSLACDAIVGSLELNDWAPYLPDVSYKPVCQP